MLLPSEFRDAEGRPLQRRLDETGLPAAAAYVRTLVVVNGDRRSLCQSSLALAWTRPGSRVVSICSRRFERRQALDPVFAAAVVIHETLHTLGLGENPPSSEEITARILAHCGR